MLRKVLHRLDNKTSDDIKILTNSGLPPIKLLSLNDKELREMLFNEDILVNFAKSVRSVLEKELQKYIEGGCKQDMATNVVTMNTIETSGNAYDAWLKDLLEKNKASSKWKEAHDNFVRDMDEYHTSGVVKMIDTDAILPVGPNLQSSLENENLGTEDKKKKPKINLDYKHISAVYLASDDLNTDFRPIKYTSEEEIEKESVTYKDKYMGEIKIHFNR